MKSQPACRPIQVFSSWTGLPSRMPQSALGCSRKSGPCQTLTVSRRRDAGADQLAPAGEAGHQVRLDQAGRDLQIGPDVARVDPDRHAARARAEERVLGELLAVMVLDAIVGGDLGADHLDQFVALVRPMQPVAMRIVILSRGMPAASSVASIGGRISWLGTGRVMSQMTMQASLRPRASSAKRRRAGRMREHVGQSRLRDRPAARRPCRPACRTTRSPGNSTSSPVRAYSSRTRMAKRLERSDAASCLLLLRLRPSWPRPSWRRRPARQRRRRRCALGAFLFLLLLLLLHRQLEDPHLGQAQRAVAFLPAIGLLAAGPAVRRATARCGCESVRGES